MKGFLKYHIKDRVVLAKQKRALYLSKEAPVLVFTMAKVGSLSVYTSLKKWNKAPVFHTHTLDENEVNKGEARCKAAGIYPDSRSPVSLLNEKLKTRTPVKIISLFRNPIERNISAFFDAFRIHMGVPASQYKGGLQELETAFHRKVNHRYAIDWYDSHFYDGLGINLYDIPFDTHKKYLRLQSGTMDVLLLDSRLKDIQKEQLIKDFCDLPHFELRNVNIRQDSIEGTLYKQFKDYMLFNSAYLKSQLDTPYVNHFFTELDRQEFFQKWGKN